MAALLAFLLILASIGGGLVLLIRSERPHKARQAPSAPELHGYPSPLLLAAQQAERNEQRLAEYRAKLYADLPDDLSLLKRQAI